MSDWNLKAPRKKTLVNIVFIHILFFSWVMRIWWKEVQIRWWVERVWRANDTILAETFMPHRALLKERRNSFAFEFLEQTLLLLQWRNVPLKQCTIAELWRQRKEDWRTSAHEFKCVTLRGFQKQFCNYFPHLYNNLFKLYNVISHVMLKLSSIIYFPIVAFEV